MKVDEQAIENASWISLNEDESLEAWAHPSVYPYIPVYLMGLLLVFVGFVLPFVIEVGGWWPLILVPLGGIIILVEYIRYVSVFYVFTDQRVFRKRGILTQKTRDVGYDSVEKVKTERPLIGRILSFGDIVIITASPSEEDILMTYVPEINEANSIVSKYT